METVTYRRQPVPVQTIPKGTLLFRLTKNPRNDIRGIPREDGQRCILPNHNVFFYPNPFVPKVALTASALPASRIDVITVFVLKRDVKVIWLLNPSLFSRKDKNRKRFFMKRCSTIKKGCVDKKRVHGLHGPYNPCLSDTFLEKYPDIVGMIGVAEGDVPNIQEGYKKKTRKVRKHFNFATDSVGITSIPELILHPLKQRSTKDVLVKPGDVLESNYAELTTLNPHDEESLLKFMRNHAEYNPDTFFYMYKKSA
jgi:hypothetical protein